MSFDDLQKNWAGQKFSDDAALRAGVLAKIRERERRFRRIVMIGIVRDAVMLLVLIGIVAANWQGFRLPAWLAVASVIFFVGITSLMLRLSKPLTGDLLGGPGALAEQVGRDSTRFRRLMLWGNMREFLGCLAVVWCFAVHAARAGDHPGLRWAGVGFVAVSAAVWLGRMVLIERRRPAAGETVAGELTVAIHYARAQLNLMSRLWWYFAPLVGAGACLKLIGVINGTASVLSFAIFTAATAAVLWVTARANRKLAEARLKPRAELLERLRDELTGATAKP